jgi:hypothetical protein
MGILLRCWRSVSREAVADGMMGSDAAVVLVMPGLLVFGTACGRVAWPPGRTPPPTHWALPDVRIPVPHGMALRRVPRRRGRASSSARAQPLDYRTVVRRHFKPLLANAGLPNIRLYDLRHTCATLLLSRGEHPKIVGERLGHSSTTLTLDTYSHVLPDMQEQAAVRLEETLFS